MISLWVLSSWWLSLSPPPQAETISTAVFLVQQMFRQSRWCVFMSAASGIPRRHNLTTNSQIFWLLQSFTSVSTRSLSLRCSICFVDGSIGTGLHNSFFLVVVFCDDLCLEQGNCFSHIWRLRSRTWRFQQIQWPDGGITWFKNTLCCVSTRRRWNKGFLCLYL